MRRKYDLRNKRSFLIILILAILVIGVFSLFIYKYIKSSKIQYQISAGSLIQDIQRNYLKIDDDAILKRRWNDNYYLEYQDESINLGKQIIVYNEITSQISLYGEFYEILSSGEISHLEEETILSNNTEEHFYKIVDREYLLVAPTIKSSDDFTTTSSYLLVELDKQGNAKLSNNNINLKTIKETTLVTSTYMFDINNEILSFGTKEIDLKKIIGSSNEYIKEEEESPSNGGETNDNQVIINDNTQQSTNSSSGVINNTPQGDNTNIDEIIDKTKMTSIVRVSEGLTQIDVDYIVYDPYNEYTSIYAEIAKNGTQEVIYLSKNDTHIVFNNLTPDTAYTIDFVYTTTTETGELIRNTFERLELKTKKPSYTAEIYRISSVTNMITYKIYMDSTYKIDSMLVNISFNYNSIDPETGETTLKEASIDNIIEVTDINKYIISSTSLSGYNIDRDTIIKITVKSVTSNSHTIDISSSYSFKFGR